MGFTFPQVNVMQSQHMNYLVSLLSDCGEVKSPQLTVK